MSDRRSGLLDATITVVARRGVRGLRVQEVAAEAGVSVPLIYHYFGSREGLLDAALGAVDERAARYSTAAADATAPAREQLVERLLGELQDDEQVRTTSRAWGELCWAAAFEEPLRPAVRRLTATWVDDVAGLVGQVRAQEGTRGADPRDSAEILVALVEGLSGRWHCDVTPVDRLRHLVRVAVDAQLGPAPARGRARRRA